MKKTLTEVIKEVGLTRRQIQEYEAYGTERDKDKNRRIKKNHLPFCFKPEIENGKLMYNDEAVERLWQIRFYRELGFSKDEISNIFNNENYDKINSLKSQIQMLEEKKQELEILISSAKGYLKTGISVFDRKSHIIDYPLSFNFIVDSLKLLDKDTLELIYTEYNIFNIHLQQYTEVLSLFQEIMIKCFKNNENVENPTVQTAFSDFYYAIADISKKSKLYFSFMIMLEFQIWLKFALTDSKDDDYKKSNDFVVYIFSGLGNFLLNSKELSEVNSFSTILYNYSIHVPFNCVENINAMKLISERITLLFEITNENMLINWIYSFLCSCKSLISTSEDKELIEYLIEIIKILME